MSRRDEIRSLSDQIKVLGDDERTEQAEAKKGQAAIDQERRDRLWSVTRANTRANTDLVAAASEEFKKKIDDVTRSYTDKIHQVEKDRDAEITELQRCRQAVYDEAELAMVYSRNKMLVECDAKQKALDAETTKALEPIYAKRKELKLRLEKLEQRKADATPVDVPSQPKPEASKPPETPKVE